MKCETEWPDQGRGAFIKTHSTMSVIKSIQQSIIPFVQMTKMRLRESNLPKVIQQIRFL